MKKQVYACKIKNKQVYDLAIVLDGLVNRYPGRNIMKIMFDAGSFTGESGLPDKNNDDMIRAIQRYYNGHD